MGTLISYLPGFEWYYNACTSCNKKVTTAIVTTDAADGSGQFEDKNIIKCPNNCNPKLLSTAPRLVMLIEYCFNNLSLFFSIHVLIDLLILNYAFLVPINVSIQYNIECKKI